MFVYVCWLQTPQWKTDNRPPVNGYLIFNTYCFTKEALAKVLFCHSRGSNRESGFFKKQRLLDTRFHGYDGTGYFEGIFVRTSKNKFNQFS